MMKKWYVKLIREVRKGEFEPIAEGYVQESSAVFHKVQRDGAFINREMGNSSADHLLSDQHVKGTQ